MTHGPQKGRRGADAKRSFGRISLAETVPDTLLSSLDGVTCDFVDQRAVEYTGLPVRSINGTGWHQVVCPDDLEYFLAATDLSRKNGEPLDREVRLRGADGIYRWFRVRFDPLRDAAGTIVKWVGAASNVDDLKKLQHQLDLKTQALEALNAGLGNPIGTCNNSPPRWRTTSNRR